MFPCLLFTNLLSQSSPPLSGSNKTLLSHPWTSNCSTKHGRTSPIDSTNLTHSRMCTGGMPASTSRRKATGMTLSWTLLLHLPQSVSLLHPLLFSSALETTCLHLSPPHAKKAIRHPQSRFLSLLPLLLPSTPTTAKTVLVVPDATTVLATVTTAQTRSDCYGRGLSLLRLRPAPLPFWGFHPNLLCNLLLCSQS